MSAPGAGSPPAAPALPPRRRFRLRHLLRGLAILAIGMVIGSAATAHFGHRMMMKIMGDPAKMGERLHHRLDRELDLTPEQSKKIGAIISDHSTNFANIIRVTQPRLMQEFDQMSAEIRRELSPEQAEDWDKIHERMKNHFPPPFLPPSGAGGPPQN